MKFKKSCRGSITKSLLKELCISTLKMPKLNISFSMYFLPRLWGVLGSLNPCWNLIAIGTLLRLFILLREVTRPSGLCPPWEMSAHSWVNFPFFLAIYIPCGRNMIQEDTSGLIMNCDNIFDFFYKLPHVWYSVLVAHMD